MEGFWILAASGLVEARRVEMEGGLAYERRFAVVADGVGADM